MGIPDGALEKRAAIVDDERQVMHQALHQA
jgi:hypothetical protein